MTEQKLKEYFQNKITYKELKTNVSNSQFSTGYDTTRYIIDQNLEEDFEIKREHLIQLCTDYIHGEISAEDLNTIAFCFYFSDNFDWDDDRINRVIFEWENPELGHDIHFKNVLLWRNYLITGKYELDENELKEKFRSKGKYLKIYQTIDEILWKEWNPLNIQKEESRAIYQKYTPIFTKCYKAKFDAKKIADKLYKIELEELNLSGDYDRCYKIACEIKKLEAPE